MKNLKIFRMILFVVCVWILAVVPWLTVRAFYSNDWVKWSLIFGSQNTVAIIVPSLFWLFLRNKFKVPSLGIILASLHILFMGIIIISCFVMQNKEPLIWEGLFPLIFIVCPINIFIKMIIPFRQLILQIVSYVCFGAVYYFCLGRIFEVFVLKYFSSKFHSKFHEVPLPFTKLNTKVS